MKINAQNLANKIFGDKSLDKLTEIEKELAKITSTEEKNSFITEIKTAIETELNRHRKAKHNGQAKPTCKYEIALQKLIKSF